MKRIRLSIIVFCTAPLFFAGCLEDPNEKANELYVEAGQVLQMQVTEGGSYSALLESYEVARDRIDVILSEYPSSHIAGWLLAGSANIYGLTLVQFQGLESAFREMAAAEQVPSAFALLALNTVVDSEMERWKLLDIAGIYAKLGQQDQAADVLSNALETAKTIDDSVAKAEALAEIAGKYSEVGLNVQANGVLSQALKISKAIEDDSPGKDSLLVLIASKYAEAGKLNEAFEIAKASGLDYAVLLIVVEGKDADEWQQEQAADLLAEALEAAKTWWDPRAKAAVLTTIAGKYAEKAQLDLAADVLDQAWETAKTLDRDEFLVEIWTEIAGTYAELGQPAQAADVLEQAVETAKTTHPDVWYDAAILTEELTEIAGAYAEAGQPEQAADILAQAMETTKTIDRRLKSEVLVQIAGAYAEAGQPEQAADILLQAFDSGKAIQDDFKRARNLAEIAAMYAALGMQPNEETRNSLRELTRRMVPMKRFLEEHRVSLPNK